MEARNLSYTSDGAVMLEINHPVYGWIPFMASPDDCEAHGRELYARAIAGEFGDIAPYVAPVKTLDEQLADLEKDLDAHLDAVAKSYRFGDRKSLALRASYPNVWRDLGTAYGTWMDQCNALVAAGLAEVIAGMRPVPTAGEMIAGLPVFTFEGDVL